MMDNEGIFEAGKMRKKSSPNGNWNSRKLSNLGRTWNELSLSPRVIALEPSMEEGKPEVTKKNMH